MLEIDKTPSLDYDTHYNASENASGAHVAKDASKRSPNSVGDVISDTISKTVSDTHDKNSSNLDYPRKRSDLLLITSRRRISFSDCVKETETFLKEHLLNFSIESTVFDPLTGKQLPVCEDEKFGKDAQSKHGAEANLSECFSEKQQEELTKNPNERSSNLDIP